MAFSQSAGGISPLWFILVILVAIILFVAFRRPGSKSIGHGALFMVNHRESPRVDRGSHGERLFVTDDPSGLPLDARLSLSPDDDDSAAPLPIEPGAQEIAIIPPDPFRPIYIRAGGRVYADRFFPFDGITNFRDFGGYLTSEGRQVRWGQLYRSSYLAAATPADHAKLEMLGIRLVADLRTFDEVAHEPDSLPSSIRHWHVPVLEKDPPQWLVAFNRNRTGRLFEGYYRDGIIDQGAPAFGAFYRALLDPANRPALVHCSAGKDRAGMAAALLLLLLGVPEEKVIEDYTLSNLAAERLIARTRQGLEGKFTFCIRVGHLLPMLAAYPELLKAGLQRVESYGGVEAYLTGPAGMALDEIARLREVFLFPA